MTSSSTLSTPPVRLLIINPNTSVPMTEALKPIIENLGYHPVSYTYFTCPPPGIPSINSPSDAARSAEICLPHLLPLLPHHDAFLVACYSEHPLVPRLKAECHELSVAATGGSGSGARKYVTGIFEASVTTSLSLLDPGHNGDQTESFGIVSTGKVWEDALSAAVHTLLGVRESIRFEGCETTGLDASQLHDLPAEVVRRKMIEATKRLLVRGMEGGSNVKAICLGCAGMVGLDEAVREACVEELGVEEGRAVHIVDGVKAGVGTLIALARGGF